jgi:hypothetical protein
MELRNKRKGAGWPAVLEPAWSGLGATARGRATGGSREQQCSECSASSLCFGGTTGYMRHQAGAVLPPLLDGTRNYRGQQYQHQCLPPAPRPPSCKGRRRDWGPPHPSPVRPFARWWFVCSCSLFAPPVRPLNVRRRFDRRHTPRIPIIQNEPIVDPNCVLGQPLRPAQTLIGGAGTGPFTTTGIPDTRQAQ